MSSQKHEFVKNVCKICGLSKASVQHFKWTCKEECEVVDCLFCGTRNRLNDSALVPVRVRCGRCRKPLFLDTPKGARAQLEHLVGLENVKNELRQILAVVSVSLKRMKQGFRAPAQTLHFVFQGSPGTGKTQVARLLASGLKDVGYLAKGQLVETDRTGLVGQYHGHTEERVMKKCEEALGGVLFIDEAYALVKDDKDVFGRIAIDTLLKFMEDHRRDLVVIVAGYTAQMRDFLQSNPGLKSRFTRFINFPDYSPQELSEIFRKILNENRYYVAPEVDDDQLVKLFRAFAKKDPHFGNARGVRNVAERLFAIQAERLASCANLTAEQCAEIVAADFVKLCTSAEIPARTHAETISKRKPMQAALKRRAASAKKLGAKTKPRS
jgi:stage V sporulation protein K